MFGWLSRLSFRRVIAHGRFIPEIDGFRFVAIMIVILAHASALYSIPSVSDGLRVVLRREVINGKIGVYLFFAISGFILALPFAKNYLLGARPVNISRYFMRRLTRLEPPYILIMLIRFPLEVLYKHAKFEVFGFHLLASLLYIHSFVYNHASIIYPAAWSLEIEVQFYILAPLLTMVFMIRKEWVRKLILVGAILGSALASKLLIVSDTRAALSILNYLQYFLAGFLLCDIYLEENYLRIPERLWDLFGFLALALILFSDGLFASLVVPFTIVVFYLAGFRGRITQTFFSIPVITTIGGMCYSLYLTHMLVLTGVSNLSARFDWTGRYSNLATVAGFILSVVLVLAIGTVYFLLIERPCMYPDWPKTFAQRLEKVFASISIRRTGETS